MVCRAVITAALASVTALSASAQSPEQQGDSVVRKRLELRTVEVEQLRVAGQPKRAAELELSAGILAQDTIEDATAALPILQRAAALAHEAQSIQLEGDALRRAAAALHELNREQEALAVSTVAVGLLRTVDSTSLLSDALAGLGAIHASMERHDLALVAYEEALKVPRVHRSMRANAFNSLGMTYYAVGRSDSALFFLDSALRTAPDTDAALRIDAFNNEGLVHLERGSTAKSAKDRAELNAALEGFRESLGVLGDDTPDDVRAITLSNIGVAHRRLFQLGDGRRHLDSALADYNKALCLQPEKTQRKARARTRHNIALIYGDRGDAQRSRALLDSAMQAHALEHDRNWQGMALAELASSWRRLSPRDLRRAAKLYDSAAAIFAAISGNAGGDANRLGYAEQRMVRGVFDDWALTSLHLGVDGARKALRAAERGRAQALLHLMRDSTSSPELAAINYASLSYLLTRDTLIIWITQPSGAVHHVALPISMDSVSALVEDARMAIDARSAQTGIRRGGFGDSHSSKRRPVPVDAALRRLANLLLPTKLRRFLPDTGTDLVVIPSGALGLVPFAALPLGRDGEPLGIRYALRYAPSFATLALADSEAAHRPDPRTVGWAHSVVVGDPLMPRAHEPDGRSLAFDPLSDARTEAIWLADSLRVQPLIGPSATEDSVTALMPDAPLIHLATHGLAYDRDDRARASFVVLASGRKGDGLLTVGEILDDTRPLHASLVVLSACETALGDVKQSEGTVGLQRAFLARRASSVLVSLWSVSDEATALLMRRFYERWLDDKDRISKAEALRLAERDVRNALGKDRPELWAGFQLVGAR